MEYCWYDRVRNEPEVRRFMTSPDVSGRFRTFPDVSGCFVCNCTVNLAAVLNLFYFATRYARYKRKRQKRDKGTSLKKDPPMHGFRTRCNIRWILLCRTSLCELFFARVQPVIGSSWRVVAAKNALSNSSLKMQSKHVVIRCFSFLLPFLSGRGTGEFDSRLPCLFFLSSFAEPQHGSSDNDK